MVNYGLFLKEIEALEKSVEDAYGDVLYVDEKAVTEIKDQIKQNVGGQFSDDVIECFVYKKEGIGDITFFMFDKNRDETMKIGKGGPSYIFDISRGMASTDIYSEERDVRQIIQNR